jgi:hypothetical protein
MGVSFPGVAVGAPVLVSQAADASPIPPTGAHTGMGTESMNSDDESALHD